LIFFGLTASAHSVVEHEGYYEVEHSWEYNKKNCTISLNISKSLYDYFQNEREHLAYRYQFQKDELSPNYYSFMLSEHDRPVIRSLAREFYGQAASEEESILFALTFVQSLPYAYDSDSKGKNEYMRYPVETLVDGCGDCEDKVALLVALLYEMDVDFVLLVLPEHMAVGVHSDEIDLPRYLLYQGKKYYFLETTMLNWGIGDIPENYRSAKIEVVPVDATPSMLVKGVKFESQEALVYEKADCELELDLHNLGPGKVTELGVVVRIIEKGKGGGLLVEEYYSLDDLQEGEQRTELLFFKSRIKENCLIQVELSSWEINTQYYEVELGYSRIRR
jgi:hypothetical protein